LDGNVNKKSQDSSHTSNNQSRVLLVINSIGPIDRAQKANVDYDDVVVVVEFELVGLGKTCKVII
jgi:hypothetical protein